MATRKLGCEDGILGQDWPHALLDNQMITCPSKRGKSSIEVDDALEIAEQTVANDWTWPTAAI